MSCDLHDDGDAEETIPNATPNWMGYLLNDCITDDILSSILSYVTFGEAYQIVSSLTLLEKVSGCKEKRSWRSLHVWKEVFLRDGYALDDGDDRRKAVQSDNFCQSYIDRQRLFDRLCHKNPVISFAASAQSSHKTNHLSVPIPNFIPMEYVLGGPSVQSSDVPPTSLFPCQFQLVSLATGSSIVFLHQKPCTNIERDANMSYEMMTSSLLLLPKFLLNLSSESYGDDLLLEAFPRNHILMQWDHPVTNRPACPVARLLPCKQLVLPDGVVSALIGCAIEVHESTGKMETTPDIYTQVYIWRVRFGNLRVFHGDTDENWRYLSHGTSVQLYACCKVPGTCDAMDYHCPSNGESKLYLTKMSPQILSTTLEVHSIPRCDDSLAVDAAMWSAHRRLGVFDIATPTTTSNCALEVDSTGRVVVVATPEHIQIWNVQAIIEKKKEAIPNVRSRQVISDAILHINILKRIRDIAEVNQTQATSALYSILLGNIDNPRIPPRPQQNQAVVDVGIHFPRHLPIHQYGFITLHTTADVNDNRHVDISHTAAIALPYLVVWEFQPHRGPSDPQNAAIYHHESSWVVCSVINLPLLSLNSSKPRVQYDGRRIVVFGQDFLGHIVLVYQFTSNECATDSRSLITKSLPSSLPFIPRNEMEESGGVYNFSYPSTSNGSTKRMAYQSPRRFVKFVKRIRHDALHGEGSWGADGGNQPLQMSCNERFLVFRTKKGDRLRPQYLDEWPPSFSDGFLYFDLDEEESP